jgi:hypothetical protein
VHFRNFRDFGNPPKKPCFHKKPLCSKVQRISRNSDFGDFGDLGDTLHIVKKFPENFGKTGNSG